jgi:diacylglycerol kinase (ATP)
MSHHETPNPFKSHGGWRRLRNAARYSLAGYRAAFAHEAAFRQELAVVALLTPCAFWLGDSLIDVVVLLAALGAVLVAELLNSAIEALADAISTNTHPLLGRAKDLGSAAVMLAILLAAGIWLAFLCARMMQ